MAVFYDAECKTCGEVISRKDGVWGHNGGNKDHYAIPKPGTIVKTTIR